MCDAALSPEDKPYQEVSTGLQESHHLSLICQRMDIQEVYAGDSIEVTSARGTGSQWPFKQEQLSEQLRRAYR